MTTDVNKQMHEEMVGVLTAISIVSKRLASRLAQLDKNDKDCKTDSNHEEKRGADDGIQD